MKEMFLSTLAQYIPQVSKPKSIVTIPSIDILLLYFRRGVEERGEEEVRRKGEEGRCNKRERKHLLL